MIDQSRVRKAVRRAQGHVEPKKPEPLSADAIAARILPKIREIIEAKLSGIDIPADRTDEILTAVSTIEVPEFPSVEIDFSPILQAISEIEVVSAPKKYEMRVKEFDARNRPYSVEIIETEI